MKLEGLPSGDTERWKAITQGEFIELQPLLRRADSAGHADTNQEAVSRFKLAPEALLTEIAVILLIGAMKLQELGDILGHRTGYRVSQAFGDGAAQVATTRLEGLFWSEFRRLVGGHGRHP